MSKCNVNKIQYYFMVFFFAFALLSGGAAKANTEWHNFNGGYSAERYSPLNKSTPKMQNF